MAIHPSKTKELVIYRARRRSPPDVATPIIEGAERVLSFRVLGVILDSKLSMAEHITAILSTPAPPLPMRCAFCALMASSLESYTWSRELQLWPHCSTQPQHGGGSLARGDVSAQSQECDAADTCPLTSQIHSCQHLKKKSRNDYSSPTSFYIAN